MRNITIAMNADSCVLSVRLRRPVVVRAAATHGEGQGTAVSILGLTGGGTAVVGAPVNGDFSAVAPTYKTTDVARFRSGRPPV